MSEPLTTHKMRGRLTSKPGPVVAADRTRGMSVTVIDLTKLFCAPIALQWMGSEATEFYERHKAELVPGRCLDLELFSFFPDQGQQRASVKTCQIAPMAPSWIKHAEKMNSAKPANPPTPGLRIV